MLAGTDLVNIDSEYLKILTAKEPLEVNQDLGIDGRIQGIWIKTPSTDASTAVGVTKCGSSASQQWEFQAGNAIVHKATGMCVTIPNCQTPGKPGIPLALEDCSKPSGSCGGANQRWQLNSNKTLTSELDGNCIDIFEGRGPEVTAHTCNNQGNEQWTFTNGKFHSGEGNYCLDVVSGPAPSSSISLWAKNMSDTKRVAVVLVNEGEVAANATLHFQDIGFAADTKVSLRDLWTQADIGTRSGNYIISLEAFDSQMLTVQAA